ncbi:AAC(3) family N-acetyltransferase [Halobacillus salinarum]|uniref:Aminoglycoside N(3)-acetyltransferase n=1 Tax=Halobacillus salinarum TaxID=2932257 RepID=A0ABY4EG43_9BACI|nr:AAC(3) family N-acetyltransferase [Halobacillus salinarum]UOQ42584.1 AAC(3) family N-acetyltransferase [Halobacillus salinarum]
MKNLSKQQSPRTRQTILEDLRSLGVKKGTSLLVHSSLSSIGWVNGGAVAVNLALMDAVSNEGTIIMPSQSDDMSDPAEWTNPPVPEEWIEEIERTLPAYHPDYTPALRMGRIVEAFRTFPDVKRSAHPLLSFAGWGRNSRTVIKDHFFHTGLGKLSPLQKLYDLDAHVLFLGTSYESCTCFHLAEYRIPKQTVTTRGAPVLHHGRRVWVKTNDIEFRDDLFGKIGVEFEQKHEVAEGQVGSASAKLFSLKEAVDYAELWLKDYDDE